MGALAVRRKRRLTPRLDIFQYHDHRAFLRDWFAYLKEGDQGFSLRALAESSGLGSGYLTMILSGERSLTHEVLERIIGRLSLKPTEQRYLKNMVKLAAERPEAKIVALRKMSRSPAYKRRNPSEAEFVDYMSHWWYVAIREMAAIPGFRPDPERIQEQLKGKVSIEEIKNALEFLIEAGYLVLGKDGMTCPEKQALDCDGTVYLPALTEYHKQMFALATQSIADTPAPERNLDGVSIALDEGRFQQAVNIMNRAMDEIVALERTPGAPVNRVYQLEFVLFPLTKKSAG